MITTILYLAILNKSRLLHTKIGKTLAACWALLTFDEVFRLTETDFKKLFDIGRFPFVGILGAPFEGLSNAITNDVDPTKAIMVFL